MSVWAEFGPLLSSLLGRLATPVRLGDWRSGDQRVFVTDISKAKRELGWAPQVSVRDGLLRLVDWVQANRQLFV